MRSWGFALLLWSGLASSALGQGLVIEHGGLGCVVAEKYPRLTACIAPRARVARARVYFRAQGTPSWYYVQLRSDMPCYRGVLPKPKRTLQRFSYYIAAMDTAFAETQTGEYTAEVVPDEASCRKGPLAPFLNDASVVASSAAGTSGVPPGFSVAGTGGFPTGVVLGVVGGGAAVVGGIAGIGGGKGEGRGAPSSQGPPATTAPGTPSSSPPGAPTTTLPPGTPTTTLPGAPTTTAPGTPTTTLPGTPTTTLSACAGDTTPPNVSILFPVGGLLPGLSVLVAASASDASGIARVDFYYQESGGGPSVFIGTATSPPYSVLWLFPLCSVAPGNTFTITAVATDNCGNVATSSAVSVTLIGRGCLASSAPTPPAPGWISELSVPGGHGQVVLNGTDAFFPGPGTARMTAPVRRGSNHVEALLVDGRGQPGTWRFDFGGAGLQAGSLHVVAGEVALVTPDAIVFRLSGRPGERAVFSFRRGELR